jgi:uncharacterized protein
VKRSPGGAAHDALMTTNMETTRAIYDAFARGDIPTILGHLAEDVAWERDTESYGVPVLTPGKGRDHVGRFFEELGAMEFHTFDVRCIADAGDTTVAVIWLEATVKATGGKLANLETHVWEFGPDGKIVAFNHVLDRHQFVQAFGV